MLSEGEVGLGEIEPPSAEPFTEAVDDDGSAALSPATTFKRLFSIFDYLLSSADRQHITRMINDEKSLCQLLMCNTNSSSF